MKILFLALSIIIYTSFSCTDFRFKVGDSSVFSARTMDYPIPQFTLLKFIAPNQYYRAETLDWYIQNGYLSFSALGENHTADGLNTCGMSCALLALQQTEYQPLSETKPSVGISDICDWILGQFCDIENLKQNVTLINVYDNKPFANIPTPLLHISVHDSNGSSLVIEFIKRKQIQYDNKIGILTNDPVYDWHLLNVENYNYVSNIMTNYTVKINDWISNSEYMFMSTPNYGISADDGPVSRFVRISQHLRYMYIPSDSTNAVIAGFRMLEKVAVVPGFTSLDSNLGVLYDITLYRIVRDHTNKRIYFTTYNNLIVKMIDITNISVNSNLILLENVDPINYVDLTNKFI
jgi:choloylglycine hydrolase